LNRRHAERLASLNAALAEASVVTGYDGATLLSLPDVRPPRGTPITNPANVRPTANGIELLAVTEDKVRGLVAARRGDVIAAESKRKTQPKTIYDMPAVQPSRTA